MKMTNFSEAYLVRIKMSCFNSKLNRIPILNQDFSLSRHLLEIDTELSVINSKDLAGEKSKFPQI